DAGLVEAEPREPAQHQVAAGAGVLQDAEHLGIEGFDLGALHDGAAGAFHARTHVVDLPVALLLGSGRGRRRDPTGQEQNCEASCSSKGWTGEGKHWPHLQRMRKERSRPRSQASVGRTTRKAGRSVRRKHTVTEDQKTEVMLFGGSGEGGKGDRIGSAL